jgi:L-threonylcarbamoyladenylate synthase
MKTTVIKVHPESDKAALSQAAACLAAGGLVVFPTETVYGLGAAATNPAALARLREVKGRSENKPFTVHIGSRSAVKRFVPNLNGVGERLTQKAWPGPITLIFEVDPVSDAPVIRESSPQHAPAMYYENTIGIRCPDDRVAAELLTAAAVPVVAASANPAGAEAPVTADEALEALDGQVDIVLDAGRTLYARPSTIVRVTSSGYEILREGVYDERTVKRLMNVNFLLLCSGNTCRSPMAAGILRRLLAQKLGVPERELPERGYYVESAGISAALGLPPTAPGVQVMSARGIDIATHRSQPLTRELLKRADYVFTMTQSQRHTVAAFDPSAAARTATINAEDIEDPIGEGEAVYSRTADHIERGLRKRLEDISL